MFYHFRERVSAWIQKAVYALRIGAGEKNYLLVLSVAVGAVAGLAAVCLKSFADFCHHQSLSLVGGRDWMVWIVPAFPALGIFFCIAFVKYWIRGPYDKSLAGVISATANGTSEIPVQKTYSHILTSGFSVGMGVSAGLEAPIALTGSAIGSNIAKALKLGRESRTLLLACGGAGGISAVFNSPVAGALFACEILLPEFSIPALVPLLMASASAAVVSEVLYSNRAFEMIVSSWHMQNLPFYILLGVLAGLTSAYIIRTSLAVAKQFELLKNVWVRGLAGALILYGTFLLMPALKGEGYSYINALIRGRETAILAGSPFAFLFENPWTFVILIGILVLVKALISAASLESGGDGGIFAPSMFMGAFLGFFMARLLNLLGVTGAEGLSEINCIAVGMGGVLAGVMHAPMTGIFLIAEITGGYTLFIPLMIVASLSCFICRKLSRYNVYKSVIQMRGGVPEPSKDAVAMEGVGLAGLLEKDFLPVHQDDTLRVLLQAVMHSRRNIFPVIDDERKLVGMVTLDNIRPFLLDDQLYDVALVYDVMSGPGPVLKSTDSLGDAMKLFESLRVWNLPVTEDGKYSGFVSKSGVFDRYRNMLRNKQELF